MGKGWTPERRARQAALLERWKPWLHNPGVKTEEGKAISCMNALKHGGRGAVVRRLAAILNQIQHALRERARNE